MTAINEEFGYPNPSEQYYPRMVEAGFGGVMLCHSDDFRASKRPLLARAAGLQVVNIHTAYRIPGHLMEDSPAGEADFASLQQCMEDCAAFEIPTMIVHPTCEEISAVGLDRFGRLAARGEALGVNIAIENLRRLAELHMVAAVLAAVDSPRMGFCFDSGHNNAGYDFEPQDLLNQHGDRLIALHLHDNDHTADQHRLPFDAVIDWPALMARIAATGYTGAVSLEVLNKGHEGLSAAEFLQTAQERAEKCSALLHAAAENLK
jgi:sugar phosphate isomerase/epimerase